MTAVTKLTKNYLRIYLIIGTSLPLPFSSSSSSFSSSGGRGRCNYLNIHTLSNSINYKPIVGNRFAHPLP